MLNFFSKKQIIKKQMRDQDLLFFTKKMYYLLKGKINIIDSLSMVSLSYNEEIKNNILKIKKNIEKGMELNKAFKEITNEKEFLEMIKIGEEIGELEKIFKNLYENYKFKIKMKKEIRNLSIYPIFVIITAIIVVFILLKLIVPKFSFIYNDIGQELPKVTKILLKISEIMDKYWAFFLLFQFFLFGGLIYLIKNNKKLFEKIQLKIYFLGELYKNIKILNFSKNMTALLNSNINFLYSLKLCSKSNSELLNEEILKIIKKIEKGISIEIAFKNSYFFNKEYINFLKVGEKTGNMEEVFYNLTEIYYEKVDEKIKVFLKILEPLSIIIVGLIIGVIIFAIMLPLFKMGDFLI